MAEEAKETTTAEQSGAGKTPDFSVSVETPKGDDKAGNETGNAGKGGASEKHDDPEYTQKFKQRLDRMRASEQRRFEAELKKREEAWEKKFKELEGRIGGSAQPKALKREDFGSDEEFAKAKREAAIDEIYRRIEEKQSEKAAKEAEAKRGQDDAEEAQRRFAQKFQQGMQRTLTKEQQAEVIQIANDEYSAVNTFLTGPAGSTLQTWLFDDCSIPADVILFLEKNSDKLEILGTLSPRKQMEQLDILERHLHKAFMESQKKGQEGNPGQAGAQDQGGERKPPVIGQFGGSSRAIADESKLSDQERVARLIKAMRTR